MNRIKFTSKVNAEIMRAIPSIAYDGLRLEQHKTRRSMIVSFVRNGEVVGTIECDMPRFAYGEMLTLTGIEGSIKPVVEFQE